MSTLLRTLTRAAMFVTLVGTPLTLVPHVQAGDSVVLEAPKPAKSGVGLVLLVSLQRG